ncbi:MAG: zinc-binding dehydrogenase [Ktedonobacteraceae bacterium]
MKTTNKITEMKAISNYTGVQAMDSSSPTKKENTMNTTRKTTGMDMKVKLSTLWIFYMFSTAYIDITTLYYSVFINHTPTVHYTQVFLLGAGKVKPVIDRCYTLSEVAEALRYYGEGHARGKVVMTV